MFGYKSGADYWLRVLDLDQNLKLYHVVSGTKTLIGSQSKTVTAGSAQDLNEGTLRCYTYGPWQDFSANGYPSGRVGLYSTVANSSFEFFKVSPDTQVRDMLGRWKNHAVHANAAYSATMIDKANSRLGFYFDWLGAQPQLIKNLHLKKFQATFAIARGTQSYVNFLFNATDQNDYDEIRLYHTDASAVPQGWEVEEGVTESQVDKPKGSGVIPFPTGRDRFPGMATRAKSFTEASTADYADCADGKSYSRFLSYPRYPRLRGCSLLLPPCSSPVSDIRTEPRVLRTERSWRYPDLSPQS